MPISLAESEVLTLTEASKILPRRNGKRPAAATLWRWCRFGIKGVRLEYIRCGRNIMTSRTALQRFFEDLARADQSRQEPVPFRALPQATAKEVEARRAETRRILESVGL